MKQHTDKLLEKAMFAIEAAETLLNTGRPDFSAGRAYYAMFYVAEALLNEKDLHFHKHGDVIAAFGKLFAKPKVLDPKYHRWLMSAFDTRIIGDYAVDSAIDEDITANLINQAREFLEVAQKYLETN